MQELYFRDRLEFRHWLEDNFESKESIWIRLNKKDKSGLTAQQALEEALCFGWIDSIIKREDDTFYLKKFSKRRDKSRWSENNRKLVGKLMNEGKMAGPGLKTVDIALKNGGWETLAEKREITGAMIGLLREKLINADPDGKMFDGVNPSNRKMLAAYYYDAIKEETREKRLKNIIEGLRKGSYLF